MCAAELVAGLRPWGTGVCVSSALFRWWNFLHIKNCFSSLLLNLELAVIEALSYQQD